MTQLDIESIVDSCIGPNYTGPCKDHSSQFVRKLLRTRDLTSKFVNRFPMNTCTRDRKLDSIGKRLTCSNLYCRHSHGSIETLPWVEEDWSTQN